MATHPRIPVTVLTGFLGSGKSTLLNRLLRHPDLADTAVVVNELGEIGIDQLLVAGVCDNVLLLDSGCLCCTALNSFRETLADLQARRASGELPAFRRLVVETTGLADPGPILQSLLRDSLVTHYYSLDGLVTTVDAVFGEAELAQYVECRQQVSLADRLLVTKSDQTGGACPAALRGQLRALNQAAPILVVPDGAVPPAALLGAAAPAETRHTMVDTAGQRHTDGVRTDSFVIDGEIRWAGLAGWCDALCEFFGSRILRCKGILLIADIDRPVLVQGVQSVFAAPLTLPRWPDDDRRSRLVVISRGVDERELRATLSLLHAEPGTFRPGSLQELLATPPERAGGGRLAGSTGPTQRTTR